jgi:hypothetical protein
MILKNFKGIGLDSADEYHLTERQGIVNNFNSDDEGPIHQTLTGVLHIRDGISEKANINIETTINANGKVTIDNINFKLVCD